MVKLVGLGPQVDAASWDSLSAEDRATIEDMGVQAAKLSSGGDSLSHTHHVSAISR